VVRGVKHPVSGIRTFRTTIDYMYKGEPQRARIAAGGVRAYVNRVRLLPGSDYRGVKVIRQGLFTTLIFEFGDLIVRAGFQQGVVVSIGGLLIDDVNGLCGSWNQNIEDDQTDDVTGLLDNWTRPTVIEYDDEDFTQANEQCVAERFETYIRGPLVCGLLNTELSALSLACNAHVDVSQRFEECVHALSCVEQNFLPTLESSVIGYLTECIMESEDPPLVPIRENTGMQYVCAENSHYVPALTSCPKTCADRDGSICDAHAGLQRFLKVEGCECDDGFIWSGSKCVQEDYCGCVSPIDGIYFQHGDCYTAAGCTQRCQCRSGAWECEESRCYRNQKCGLVDELPACINVDKCRVNNGGCSHKCAWNAETDEVTCACPHGFALTPDVVTCVAVANSDILVSRCSAEMADWRKSYLEWKVEFVEWQAKSAACAAEDEECATAPKWRLEGELLGIGSGEETCDVYWTEWFDSDNADGCGDDETLDRLRDFYPDKVCDAIITMESRIEAAATCVTGITGDIILKTNSRTEGLFCDNADQPLGIRCPDYSVRFLCAR